MTPGFDRIGRSRLQLVVATATVLSCLLSCQSRSQLLHYRYSAAQYVSVAGVSQSLEIFPLGGKAFQIDLPFPSGALTYSPSGKALFAAELYLPGRPFMPGIFKIEFNPTRFQRIRGSEELAANSLALTRDEGKIIVAGSGKGEPCAIFELDPGTGKIRTVFRVPNCDPFNPLAHWGQLSVSPGGERATALRNHHLETIDLLTGRIAATPDNLVLGAWSPDGNWLAGQESGSGQTLLLDTRTLQSNRRIGPTGLQWSPDSRYLLSAGGNLTCGLEFGTLSLVDVNTDKRFEIASSKCRIYMNTVGWISSDIKP